MARAKSKMDIPDRVRLLVPLEEARARVLMQLERGNAIPNASINENDEARRWYDFTSELLRQICTNDELQDEFTGKSGFSFGGDISTGSYLKKLQSIYERLELIPASETSLATGQRVAGYSREGNQRRVFVVHGHDDGAKEAVARYLTKLELDRST